MDFSNELIQFIKSKAPNMELQEINDELKKPHGRIQYDEGLMKHVCQRKELLTLIESASLQQIEENQQKSQDIINYLQEIVTKWAKQCAMEKRINEDHLKFCNAILVPYGSVLLGVADAKSDIDLICIAPESIDRAEQFFNGLFYLLEKEEGMEQINRIEQTSNPIIKMIYKGYHIDISFAQVNMDRVPENIDLHLDTLRRNLLQSEDKSIYALNGRKNGLLISKSMPDHQQFVETLRIIKFWSKKRKVSSNILGYFGGITWAILTSKICQLFPNLDCCQTVELFFQIYSLWDWKIPIIIDDSDNEIDTFKTQCWKLDRNKEKTMQIITPAYPFFNTTFKVCKLTYNTLTSEFKRSAQVGNNIQELFENYDFYKEFEFVVVLSIVSNNNENFHKWTGFCEAQIPKLLRTMEGYYDEESFEIRIAAEGEENLERDFKRSLTYFIGLKKLKLDAWPLFLRTCMSTFSHDIANKKSVIFSNFEDYNMKIYLASREDLDKLRGSSPIIEPEIQKKVKLNEEQNSAYLQKQISQMSQSVEFNINCIDIIF